MSRTKSTRSPVSPADATFAGHIANAAIANNAIIVLSASGTLDFSVYNGSAAGAHFVVDVNGYFK